MTTERLAYTFQTYCDATRSGGKWRWRCRASNGRIVAASGEAFATRANADRAMRTFVGSASMCCRLVETHNKHFTIITAYRC